MQNDILYNKVITEVKEMIEESGGGGHTEEEINALVSGEFSGDLTYTATSVGKAFSNAYGTFTLNFPDATSVKNVTYLMENCQATSVKMPNVESTLSQYMITGSKIATFFAPKATLGTGALRNASYLQTAVVGSLEWNNTQCINDSSLKTVDIGNSSGRMDNTFRDSCGSLDTLILRGTTVLTLLNTTALGSTCFKSGGTGGDIYIPKSLYDALGTGTNDYKAATNWSTVDGYGTITWHAIEGSQYENYYADGTPIPT